LIETASKHLLTPSDELEQGEAYKAFQTRYFSDPVSFARECIDWSRVPKSDGLAPYQNETLAKLPEQRRVSLRGPHGLGKSAFAAITILWFALTRDGRDWKIPTTASAWRQLTKYLWPEIHKWTRYLRWDVIGREPFGRFELQTLSMKLKTGEAFALASNNHELLEGAHADHILYVFDESKAIPAETFDAAEGAFSTGEAFALAISTPGAPVGRFYEIQSRKPGYEDWWVRHVTRDECISAGRMAVSWADQRRKQWGEKSSIYLNRVEGEFAAADEDSIIPLAWVEQAVERWYKIMESGDIPVFKCVGVDVARQGSDKTVIALRYGYMIKELRHSQHESTVQTAGRVSPLLRANKAYYPYAVVDVIGYGAGVVDTLRDAGYRVYAFNAAEKTDRLDEIGEFGFTNKRSAGWWNLREMLDPERGVDVALPDDQDLIGDLTTPKWRVVSGGRVQVEPKEDIIKRLGHSPDAGDAVVMAFWEDMGASWEDLEGLGQVEGYESKWA